MVGDLGMDSTDVCRDMASGSLEYPSGFSGSSVPSTQGEWFSSGNSSQFFTVNSCHVVLLYIIAVCTVIMVKLVQTC